MSAYGYTFIFGSVIFYAFLGFILSNGGYEFLTAEIPDFSTITGDNFATEIWIVLTNPLTSIGFLVWLSVGIFVTDVFIIVGMFF